MHGRVFSSKINPSKWGLELSLEWHKAPSVLLQKQIVAIHMKSFLDLYSDISEQQLGLKEGLTKETWLRNMISEELEEINQGKLFLATISLQDSTEGFIVCQPAKARHADFKVDVYISLLAISPCYHPSGNKIRIGLGQKLVENVFLRFPEANTVTLDTRHINHEGIKFYEKLGFSSTSQTLGGSDNKYYVGYEKKFMRDEHKMNLRVIAGAVELNKASLDENLTTSTQKTSTKQPTAHKHNKLTPRRFFSCFRSSPPAPNRQPDLKSTMTPGCTIS